MTIRKFRTGRVPNATASTWVGEVGTMFYDESTGQLKISDGHTVGGHYINLVVATSTQLGGIKAGPGAVVGSDGLLTIDTSGLPLNVGDLAITQANISTVNGNEDLNLITNGTGNVNIIGNLRVQTTGAGLYSTPVFNVDNRGNLTVNGNLITNGGTFLKGTTTFVGATVHQGNITTNGNLITNGASYFNGPVTEVGNLTITGNANIAGPASYYGAQTTYGDSAFNGNVAINGTTTFNGAKITVGNNTITGNSIVNGPSYNNGVSYFYGNVNTVGNLQVTGNTAMVGNVVQLGNLTIIGNTINNGTSYFNGQNNFVGNLNIVGSTFVTGNTTVTGAVTTITGNAYLTGNAVLTGTSYIVGNTYVTGNMTQTGETIFVVTQQNSTQGAIEITGDTTAQWQTPINTGVMLQVTGQSNLPNRVYVDSLGSYNVFTGRRFEGTMASPTGVQGNIDLIRYSGVAYNTSGWANIGPARMSITTNEIQTSTNQGGRIEFWTTANSAGPAYSTISRTATIDPALGVTATGFVTAGNVTAGNVTTTGQLTVNKIITSNGVNFAGNLSYGAVDATVTQQTSKSTGVTANGRTGVITTSNANLNAGAEVTFTVTNGYVLNASDIIILNFQSRGTGTYMAQVTRVAAGAFDITITNLAATNNASTLIFNFAVIRTS